MRKVLRSKSGYAMTELLVASVVILGLFSLLFANFMPLMTEYENREYYNNVTSKYAAFYIRKMYMNALNDPKTGIDMKAALNQGIARDNYYKVYGGKENILCASVLLKDEKKCKDIIREYKIKEVMVTNYKLENLKETYPKTGELYKYINDLPKYKNNSGTELYRLIIKTEDYGYATTAILSNYKTDSKCFIGTLKENDEIEITDYLYDKKDCSDKVILSKDMVTVKDKSGNDITGFVTSIGKRAFKNKDITSISYPISVTEIKEEAFKNTKLEEFKFNATLTNIGKEAFSNTLIKEITIPNYVYFDDYAFRDNEYLTNINISPGVTSIMNNDNIMTKGLFENCGNGNDITLSIPSSMEYIGGETFNNTYVKNLDFGNTNLKGIEKEAFSVQKGKDVDNFVLPSSLTSIGEAAFKNNYINLVVIPKKVKHIDAYAFNKSKIKSLVINSEENLEIKNSAFRENDISDLKLGEKVVYIGSYAFENNKNLKTFNLPFSVSKIGNGALLNTSVGDKDNTFKASKDNFSWCKILFDSDKCKVSDTGSNIKIELNSKVKYVNKEAGDGLG